MMRKAVIAIGIVASIVACGDGEEVVLVEGTLKCPLVAGDDVCARATTTKPDIAEPVAVAMQRTSSFAIEANHVLRRIAAACEAIATDLGSGTTTHAEPTKESVVESCNRAATALARAIDESSLTIGFSPAACSKVEPPTSCVEARDVFVPKCHRAHVQVDRARTDLERRIESTMETNFASLSLLFAEGTVIGSQSSELVPSTGEMPPGAKNASCVPSITALADEIDKTTRASVSAAAQVLVVMHP